MKELFSASFPVRDPFASSKGYRSLRLRFVEGDAEAVELQLGEGADGAADAFLRISIYDALLLADTITMFRRPGKR